MQKKLLFISILIFFSLTNCSSEKKQTSLKAHPDDPFINSITESQYFNVKANTDNTIEGSKGTIIVLPKGCFVNENGKVINENVTVELTEALDLEEMILSNLTTTSNGKLLETDGMIYFSASAKGEELLINKDIPIHIEIPTSNRKPGMMAFKGVRGKDGNMNWIEPKEIKSYLISVDMNLLDFYPEGFEEAVIQGIPFRGHEKPNKTLIDSLYYSLSVRPIEGPAQELGEVDINEPYYNEQSKVIDGNYTDNSFNTESSNELLNALSESTTYEEACGINPATIKVIREEAYKNTLLSTREFEQRIKVLFKACRNDILEMYINNIDENLYELDRIAANMLSGNDYENDFIRFYNLKQTNVREADKYAELLKNHYEKRLKKVHNQLDALDKEAREELEKKNKATKKLLAEYKEVLLKREQHRMETYGFEWTSTGWINIDIGTIPKDWGAKQLAVTVENGSYYDNVFTYVVYPSINSIYRLNSTNQQLFYVGNKKNKEMLMPKKSEAITLAIAYKNDLQFLALKKFITGDTELTLSLIESSKQGIKEVLMPYNKFSKENRIDEDLKFMEKFDIEKKRRETLRKEQEFINHLYEKAFSCCSDSENIARGKVLFNSHCASCHSPTESVLIGPGLANTTSKYSMDFIIEFTQNSQEMIKHNELAYSLFEKWNKTIMTPQPVSDKDVRAIFNYIDGLNTTVQK